MYYYRQIPSMGYILWALLNIAFVTLFLVICFHATKLIKQKFGLFFSIVFVLGLLSFSTGSKPNNKTKDSSQSETKKWVFTKQEMTGMREIEYLPVRLKKTLIAQYDLVLSYGSQKIDSTYIPISASSYTTGLVCGTAWIPTHISVFPIGNNKQFGYHVSGVEEWRLLGKLIFTRGMGFEGTINIE